MECASNRIHDSILEQFPLRACARRSFVRRWHIGFHFGQERFEFAVFERGDEFGVAAADRERIERGGEREVEIEADHLAVLNDLFARTEKLFADALVFHNGKGVTNGKEMEKGSATPWGVAPG